MNEPSFFEALWEVAVADFGAGRLLDAGKGFRRLLSIEPGHFGSLSDLAAVHLHLGDLGLAALFLRSALSIDPLSPAASSNLAVAYLHSGRAREAIGLFRQALARDSTDPRIWNNLGMAFHAARDEPAAASALRHALVVQPDYAEAHNNLGASVRDLEGPDVVESRHARALALAPGYPEAHLNRGFLRLLQGDYPVGWAECAWRWQCASLPKGLSGERRWQGEPLAGRTILLDAEQGIGDAIQFIRFAPLVARLGARVILKCRRVLVRLFEKVEGIESFVVDEEPIPTFDMQAGLIDVPGILGITLDDLPGAVPYLTPDATLADMWQSRLAGPGLKVGLAWQGNPESPAEKGRSVPLETLLPALRVRGVHTYILQVQHGRDQLRHLPPGIAVTDLGPEVGDLPNTAAAMSALDIVLSSDTSIAHLAGALGRPTWVMLKHTPDWRWLLGRDDSPWYPTARLFRQSLPGDWEGVGARIAERLCASMSKAGSPASSGDPSAYGRPGRR